MSNDSQSTGLEDSNEDFGCCLPFGAFEIRNDVWKREWDVEKEDLKKKVDLTKLMNLSDKENRLCYSGERNYNRTDRLNSTCLC